MGLREQISQEENRDVRSTDGYDGLAKDSPLVWMVGDSSGQISQVDSRKVHPTGHLVMSLFNLKLVKIASRNVIHVGYEQYLTVLVPR